MMIGALPQVSVLLCLYNSAQYLEECINSILSQSYKNFELIIVDDGSTDNSLEIVKKYDDARIKIFSLGKNFGLIHARNFGFRESNGEFIAIMDSDDICHKDRLLKQLSALVEKEADICSSFYKEYNEKTGQIRNRTQFIRDADIKALLTVYSPLCNPSVMMRKSVIGENLYGLDYPHAEDYSLWCELAISGCKFVCVEDYMLTYRVHDSQISIKKAEIAKQSFCAAQKKYLQSFFDISTIPEQMSFMSRYLYALDFIFKINLKLNKVSYKANYQIYSRFQYRNNGILLTPFLRLERIFVSALGMLRSLGFN